jgi:hypothetical protein
MRRTLLTGIVHLKPARPILARGLVLPLIGATVLALAAPIAAAPSAEAECSSCALGVSAGSAAFFSTSSSPSPSSSSSAAMSGRPSPAQFKDTEIVDIRTGAKKKLGDLWSDRPAVIAFLRRLG